jgi:plasmid stability protein
MKTTVEIPDSLYRRLKARAAIQGKSVKDYLVEAKDRLARRLRRRQARRSCRVAADH